MEVNKELDELYDRLNHEQLRIEELEDILEDIAEYMWSIICNAGGGDLTKQSKDWQKAFKKCRKSYFAYIKLTSPTQHIEE